MRILSIWLAAIAISTATAAWADAPPNVSATSASNGQTQPIYRSIWNLADTGAIIHLQSGLVCDVQIDQFHRVNVIAFKPDGFDVGCNYAAAANDMTITEYLTRRGSQNLSDDLAEARSELLRRIDGLTLLPDSNAKDFTSGSSWLKEVYARPDGRFREGIWLSDLSGWTVEYRVTYRAERERAAFSGLAALWARAQATAGVQLTRCARKGTPTRDGSAVTDKDQLEQSLVMASLLGGAAADPKVEKVAGRPVTWCAEDSMKDSEQLMTLWHAVFDDGSDALADRTTAMTVDEPPALESAPNVLTELVDQENVKKPDRKPRWIIQSAQNGETWIYGLYDGRPPASDLAKTAKAVFAGNAKSLGGYSLKNGKLNITLPSKG